MRDVTPSFFNPEEVVTVINYIKQLLEDPELNVKEEEIGVRSGRSSKIFTTFLHSGDLSLQASMPEDPDQAGRLIRGDGGNH